MNCTDLFASIGFQCRSLPQADGEVIYCLSTPFQFFDGDGIHVFAEEVGAALRFFDGGDTLFHVAGSKLKLGDRRTLMPVRKLIKDAGADLSEDGEISASAAHADARDGFQRVISAILAVADWEEQNAGLANYRATLAAEVEFYLQQWKPGREILRDQTMVGLSGRSHAFDFVIDGEWIDVVSSRPQSTAAEVRKLADVQGVPSQLQTNVRVIIDDRDNAERARQESAILSRFANVWPLSHLQQSVGYPSSTIN